MQTSVETSERVDGNEAVTNKATGQRFCLQDYVGYIVNNEHVQTFMITLITVNAIMIGIGTFAFVSENGTIDRAFDKIEIAFLIIFTLELCLQFLYRGYGLFWNGWLVFNFFIILLSWSWTFSSVQVFLAFRLLTKIGVTKHLMTTLYGVMRQMMAGFVLIMLIMYIFGVLFTQLFMDLYPEFLSENYFGRLDNTLFTLFQIMTLDSWANIAREAMDVYPWAWAPFIAFVVIMAFVVFTLIVFVICGHISRLEQKLEEMSRQQEQTLQALENLTLQLQLKNMQHSEQEGSETS